MKAIVLTEFGGVENLEERELPMPSLQNEEVIVKVRAIGVNPVDAKTRTGKGQAARIGQERPIILGWDIAGVVEEADAGGVFKIGDEVFGIINIPGHGKAYAEFVAAPVAHLALKPRSISFEEAAASGIAAVTALQALITRGGVRSGQRVLVQAAAGGVGHFAVQIAKSLGAYVIGSSSAENRSFVLKNGADEHIDYRQEGWELRMEPVDFVLDSIGGDNIDRSLAVLKKGGVIVSLPSGLSEDVGEKAGKDGKKGIFFTVNSNKNDIDAIAAMLADGRLKPFISRRYSFSEMRAAHQDIESGRTRGKIVVGV